MFSCSIEEILGPLITTNYIQFNGDFHMEELGNEEQEKISLFIELFLSLIIRGFDEMEMQKRLKLVKLLGFMVNFGFEKTYGRLIDLEQRLNALEKTSKKK